MAVRALNRIENKTATNLWIAIFYGVGKTTATVQNAKVCVCVCVCAFGRQFWFSSDSCEVEIFHENRYGLKREMEYKMKWKKKKCDAMKTKTKKKKKRMETKKKWETLCCVVVCKCSKVISYNMSWRSQRVSVCDPKIPDLDGYTGCTMLSELFENSNRWE